MKSLKTTALYNLMWLLLNKSFPKMSINPVFKKKLEMAYTNLMKNKLQCAKYDENFFVYFYVSFYQSFRRLKWNSA